MASANEKIGDTKQSSMKKNVYMDPDDGRQRFLLELEFVQCLTNPTYIRYLAQNRYIEDEAFIGYLKYLQYWQRPEYVKFIMYPHCLFFLELLQSANFSCALAHPGNKALMLEGLKPPASFDLNEKYEEEEEEEVLEEEEEHVAEEDEEHVNEDRRNDLRLIQHVEPKEYPDFSSCFTNDCEWETPQEMWAWAKGIARLEELVLVTRNSWPAKILIGCVLGGKYKSGKKGASRQIVQDSGGHDELNARSGHTKKIDCPFRLVGSRDKQTKKWTLKVETGYHNHDLEPLDGYAHAGRLTEEQKFHIRNMTLADCEASTCLTWLKETYPGNTTKPRQVHDFRWQVYKEKMGRSSVSIFVVKFLKSHDYYVEYRTDVATNQVSLMEKMIEDFNAGKIPKHVQRELIRNYVVGMGIDEPSGLKRKGNLSNTRRRLI